MKKITSIFLVVFLFFVQTLRADEGMWLPLLLEKYNFADMQKKGFKLTPEDIYSVNKASMKDAVMIFGGGCTGEFISGEGLLITNHHCGFGAIQDHSSLQHDYLTDGFWAMNRNEELTNPGLSVTILDYMEDVTSKVLAEVNASMDEKTRQGKIGAIIGQIEHNAAKKKFQRARVAPMFGGNQYFLFVSTLYPDVRLVGAPPSAIGKFGGDTDNWEWPRHTGDFSLFRVYVDKDNNPASYSPSNVPFKPKKFFPISMKGVQKNDFTMVFGYPGRTQEYVPSFALKVIMNDDNPHKIKIRQKKIDVILAQSELNRETRIKYADKHAGISNAWKKWIGEIRGLKRLNAVEKKQQQEVEFTNWVNATAERKDKYGKILSEYEKIYTQLSPLRIAQAYNNEAGLFLDICALAGILDKNLSKITDKTEAKELQGIIETIKTSARGFYKDYDKETDRKIFAEMLQLYKANIPARFKAPFAYEIDKKYKGNIEKYVANFYRKSLLVDSIRLFAFLDKFTAKQMKTVKADPAYKFYYDVLTINQTQLGPAIAPLEAALLPLHRLYIEGLMEMQPNKIFYPDANFTLRVAYGKIDDFNPMDGVTYKHFTTIDGIMQKDNPNIYDYRVPKKMKKLYAAKDYGPYAENGELHVAFIASNHTTGGNSGSPVVNANGELIGVNFDRCWEGTMSDIMFDPARCRNIALDIRYALFVIDKFAGAGYLLKEMQLN
jgi:hypothetical protein